MFWKPFGRNWLLFRASFGLPFGRICWQWHLSREQAVKEEITGSREKERQRIYPVIKTQDIVSFYCKKSVGIRICSDFYRVGMRDGILKLKRKQWFASEHLHTILCYVWQLTYTATAKSFICQQLGTAAMLL